MTDGFVVDTSVALTWLFGEEATPATWAIHDRLTSEPAIVPGLWHLELTNILSIAERKGRVTAVQVYGFIAGILRLDIETDTEAPGRAFSHVLPLCRAHRLTSYDAVYIELALRRGLPLATLDTAMSTAARELGLTLLV